MKKLREISEIPPKFRHVFSEYESFNKIQSECFQDVFHSDKHIIISAPTGSGKTAIFELAIVRLLQQDPRKACIIYVAPIKALCKERFFDWREKFQRVGIKVKEATGDQEVSDFRELEASQIILTTPEKWDSLTRRWRDRQSFVEGINLFLIDEIHLLGDAQRGPTLEAVVSRMKTISGSSTYIRFVGVSATIPNIEDLAVWLGNGDLGKVKYFSIPDDMRPVKLIKVVLGFNFNDSKMSYFKFDMKLNYQLLDIINQYSDGKPTLIFCSTRKGVEIASKILAKEVSVGFTRDQQNAVFTLASQIQEKTLMNLVNQGIAYHHAGLSSQDRTLVERGFREGKIPILLCTTTLAMGINLPAHLVIIKSTQTYNPVGGNEELNESSVLQMMGRAGRPQFDTSGVAVIMTQESKKVHYERLVSGSKPVESFLHKSLVEHLNSEVVLQTVNHLSIALKWLQSTFLYVRAHKNPQYYGLSPDLSKERVDSKLQEMCQIALNSLEHNKMLSKDSKEQICATTHGRLMARYYISMGTVKQFWKVKGNESLPELLKVISESSEYTDFKLRMSEKRKLNDLNRSKGHECVRFPTKGKIQSVSAKVSCLIQAVLGNLTIPDPSLSQEALKIVQLAERLCRCLCEFLSASEKEAKQGFFTALYNVTVLSRSLELRLWDNSPYVSKQFRKIGANYSAVLTKAGLTTIRAICCSDPREIEKLLKKSPPFGNELIQDAMKCPAYEISLRAHEGSLEVIVEQTNKNADTQLKRKVTLIMGSNENNVLLLLNDLSFASRGTGESFEKKLRLPSSCRVVWCHLVHKTLVGVDASKTLSLFGDPEEIDDGKPKAKKPRRAVKQAKKPAPPANSPKASTSRVMEIAEAREAVLADEQSQDLLERLEASFLNQEEPSVSVVELDKPDTGFDIYTAHVDDTESSFGAQRETAEAVIKGAVAEKVDEGIGGRSSSSVDLDKILAVTKKLKMEVINSQKKASSSCLPSTSSGFRTPKAPVSTSLSSSSCFETPRLPSKSLAFMTARQVFEADIKNVNPDVTEEEMRGLFQPSLNSTEVSNVPKKPMNVTLMSSVVRSREKETPPKQKMAFLSSFFKQNYSEDEPEEDPECKRRRINDWITQTE